MPLLDLRHITRSFQGEGTETIALREINLSINTGEFISIMGRSGSGKSTLLHILGLLDRPSTGTYQLDGVDTATLTDEERANLRNSKIGFIFQVFHLLSRTTVLENVMLPLYYSSVPPAQHRARALAALEHVALTHRLNHVPSQLSGGEKQRVAIARALINDPRVIFADEPTGNLDSQTSELIMETIDKLHKSGRTIVLITHESPTAAYANRIITLHDGLITNDAAAPERHQHYNK